MDKGTLVEFRHNNDRVLAVVQGLEGKKNLVLSVASGQTHSVHPRQITFSLPARDSYSPQDIPRFWQQVQALLDPDSLAVAWELLQEERRVFSTLEIAQILFSEDSSTALYATYRLLADDRMYFKQKGEGFEPRPAAQVKEIQHQMAVAWQREQEQTAFESHLREALAGNKIAWTAAERLKLEMLERFALHEEAASDRDQAIKLLALLNRPGTGAAAFSTLVDLGIWSKHENLALRLTGIPLRFGADLEHLAESLAGNPPPDPGERLDLTHLHTYTIDDASTRDIDDGLSVEWLPDGRPQIWIHIADPTRWLGLGDALEAEARRRATSVYLPEQVIPMFPPVLSTGPMSLVQGQVRPALSFSVVLAPDGDIAEFALWPSRIRVTYRLTYEDADEMLELGAERELTAIAAAAQARYRWRAAQGAILIEMPEQDVKVVDEVPHLRVIEETPSRQLVAEMMVLAGDITARFAQAHQIPMLYRQQPPPDLPTAEDLAQIPPGPAHSFALVRCMQKAEMSVDPGRHSGLGLDAYCQVTSPIRRYADLVLHFQLKAFLRQDPLPFTAEQLRQLGQSLEPATAEAVQVERKRKRYWSLEYFRLQPPRVWRAQVLGHLREYENLALVMIDEVAFRIAVRFQRHVQPGEWVHLEVANVDPRTDLIDFREGAIDSGSDGNAA